MKKILISVSVCLVAVLILVSIGGYSVAVAQSRKVPIYGVATEERKLSISFDAAWGADKTRQILDVCDRYNVKVTFFLVGFWVDKFPDLVAEIASRGHEIGTHSETHPKMSALSEGKIVEELSSSMSKISAITGKKVEVFRPPFGDYNNTLLTCAEAMDLYTVQWSIDSLDWKGLSAREILLRVQKMDCGDIILCHNNSDHIVEALPAVFECAVNKGLQFVPIGELIYRENFTIDGNGIQISK